MRGLGQVSASEVAKQYAAKNTFFYVTSIAASLAAAGSTSSSFNIDGDSDFFWTKLNAFAMSADDGTVVDAQELPGVTVIITNQTSGRRYMNSATPLPSISGSGGLPFILPMETYFPAKATITVDYQNITDNKTYTDLYLVFVGIKAFLGRNDQ